MEYREIVSVTGLGGLYQLLATKSDGAIVRNLADGSTKFISARLHNVTPLESIEVYTTTENVRLHEVLKRMEQHDQPAPNPKNAGNEEIKAYFKAFFPEFDEDRVYVSDMKKMMKWFELLKANDLLHFEALEAGQADEAQEDVAGTVAAETEAAEAANASVDAMETAAEEGEKPAKKSRAKKAAATEEEGAEKPAKKTASRKKKEEDTNPNTLF